jgi:ABC-type glycerol-3-phosphate transport system substrate-binding protein
MMHRVQRAPDGFGRPGRLSAAFRKSSAGYAIVLLALLVVAAACGPPKKPVTIKIWEFPRWRETPDSLDRFYWMRLQIAEFEKLHPEVSVELTELSWGRGADKKRIAIAAGVGPDMVTGTLPVRLIEKELVESIDPYLTEEERADFFEPALDAFTYEGVTYGWPWYLTGSVMFVNLELFEKYGVAPPSPQWNYSEFLDSARRLTIRIPAPARRHECVAFHFSGRRQFFRRRPGGFNPGQQGSRAAPRAYP